MQKRAIDLVVSVLGILILSPLIMLLALLVRLFVGSPIFFCQVRPGRNAKPFKLYKFRTMTDARDENGELLADSERLSPFGQLLRSTSLDELPSLFNVLVGDMSLVGPRPLLMEYLPLYSNRQFRRHEVRPGITGWAQVNGRNAISWEKKFELDVWYVDNRSIALDLKILILTVRKVLIRDGISADGEATITPFKGNRN
ncbi:Sugar transferase involved in LPS biosynthesis (colanic, teichoic acid) [Marinobacter sp. es.042]|uniref:sugar transferase n=1 Tax=Marinobacter sp. es.042 TaxID=1761794 RepID=UPI000B501117|nr:sugar transferase [Marinobacter sp. es.042]SNB54897.1 Sugar transferase involved in LPS biosynthesis (colanic, teichoic acid) [Marinobacter sp. es.042]